MNVARACFALRLSKREMDLRWFSNSICVQRSEMKHLTSLCASLLKHLNAQAVIRPSEIESNLSLSLLWAMAGKNMDLTEMK